MTVLAIINQALDEIGLPRRASAFGAAGQFSRQVSSLANSALRELGKRNWPILETSATITTVAGQEAYDLPVDFKRTVSNTLYSESAYYKVKGALTAAEWHRQKSALLNPLAKYAFRVTGSPQKIHIVPTPTVVENITYEYISSHFAEDSGGVTKEVFTLDSDESRLPEDILTLCIKWKIKHAKGLEYNEDYNTYLYSLNEAFSQAKDFGDIAVAVRHTEYTDITDGYVPETGYGV